MAQIYPSLIAADLLNLEQVIKALDPYVDGYHIDVMDFHFVPNLTLGPDFVNAIRASTQKPLLVHLMVDYPERYFERLKLHKEDIVSIHSESESERTTSELIRAIASHGWTPSLAINPETDVSVISTIKAPFDHILLMSVNPGFSGQAFMPLVYDKISQVIDFGKETSTPYTIAIDGGVNGDNARKLVDAGAQQLVIGSALFNTPDLIKSLQVFKKSLA